MFWLGGFPALDVTTSTPDALCPPIEEARAAIKARVGEVQGDYHVEFALVRALDGRQVLQLLVHEGQRPVLERALPLDDGGCQDAAQTLALVLERYFDAVEKPIAARSDPEPIPARPIDQPEVSVARSPVPASATAPVVIATEGAWRGRGGLLYDLELGVAPTVGVALLPAALRWSQGVQVGLALDLAGFLIPLTETVREQEIKALSLQTALSIPVTWHFRPWSVSLGPWAQVRLQRAEAAGLERERPALRLVPGFGAAGELAWSPAPSWTLGWGIAVGAQARSETSRFVLRRTDAAPKSVLVPEPTFGQSQLTLALRL